VDGLGLGQQAHAKAGLLQPDYTEQAARLYILAPGVRQFTCAVVDQSAT